MRILIQSYQYKEIWTIGCLADDARTTIAPRSEVHKPETLLHLLAYIGAAEAELQEARIGISCRGSCSVWIDLIPGRKNLLRIRPPWSNGLE